MPRKPPEKQPCTMPGCTELWTPDHKRKTTLCKRHAMQATNSNPERIAKVSEGLRRKYQEPGWKEKRLPSMIAAGKRMAADPVHAERLQRTMREVGRAHGGSVAGSEERQRAGRTLSRTKLAHIPLEYRGDYLALNNGRNMPARERERLIREQMQTDSARFARTGQLPQASRKGETR